MKSRKTVMLVIGILTALLAAAQKQLGLSIDMTGAVTALMVIGTYIYGEGRNDLERAVEGITAGGKLKDPAFWVALAGPVMLAVNENTGLNIPVDALNTVIMALLGIIFKTQNTAIKAKKVLSVKRR